MTGTLIRPAPLALLGVLFLAGAGRAEEDCAGWLLPGSGWLRPAGPAQEEPPLKDRVFGRLDRLHDGLYRGLDRPVDRVDEIFAIKGRPLEPVRNSAMRLRQTFEAREVVDASPTRQETDLDVDVRLCRLQERCHLFLHSIAPDTLPGPDTTAEEGPRSWFLGARKVFLESGLVDLDAKSGVKLHVPPVAFAELAARWRVRQPAGWTVAPQQGLYWLSSDGCGTKASLAVEHWLTPGVALLHLSSARLSETSNGLEWQDVLLLGRVFRRTGREWEKSVAAQASVSGHHRGAGVVDQYRLELPVRLPIYRRWVYVMVTPWNQWRDVAGWREEYGLTLALEALFQGTPER